MSTYTPPVSAQLFQLRYGIGLSALQNLPYQENLSDDLLVAVLDEAAKLAGTVLAPLNWTGDRTGATISQGHVTMPGGFKAAYAAYRDGGWNAVPFEPAWGGQGLPWTLAFAIQEQWQAANMAFGLCPLLNQGAVEALTHHGTPALQALYLPKLISGHWTGTMNLTEPQAGSDLSLIRSRAEPAEDGTYKIFGQKIYITYGDHDMAQNIIHLVLARLPDAPAGVKGLSLFLVPKYIPNPDGTLGARNDVTCVSLEHKLGIHASPTCTMQFGDSGGAVGYVVGAPNDGLKCMFTMMNNARLSVGLQGVALCDRATQKAIAYAHDRIQGGRAIIEHGDVKRMILTMQAFTVAGRAMAYEAAYAMDSGNRARVDFLTPIVKSWCTDRAVDVASLGIQIHGGMGFVEETGAAQYLRDARILPIYEGTNGIQAADLVFRKILRDQGQALHTWLSEAEAQVAQLHQTSGDDFEVMANRIMRALNALRAATQTILDTHKSGEADRLGGIVHTYLTLCGHTLGGVLLSKGALAAHGCLRSADFSTLDARALDHQILLARFYADHVLTLAEGLSETIAAGMVSVDAARFS